MWPAHIQKIVAALDNLSTEHGFGAGSRPFIVQEVIDLGGEAVSADEYFHIGRVTEFRWGVELGETLRKRNGRKLSSFGELRSKQISQVLKSGGVKSTRVDSRVYFPTCYRRWRFHG